MQIRLLALLLFFSPLCAFAQSDPQSQGENIGISVNLLGFIFGQYSLGISTFLTPYFEAQIENTYFATEYVNPQVNGFQGALRFNYYFSSYKRSGFYLGLKGGYETVEVKTDSSTSFVPYNDFIWAIIPGYAWRIKNSMRMMLGLNYGYSLGDMQISPEINFIFSF